MRPRYPVLMVAAWAACLAALPASALESASSIAEKATTYARRGDFERAFRGYALLESRGELDWRARGDWGIALNWAERYTEAIPQLERAISGARASGSSPEYLSRALAVAYAGIGDSDSAWSIVSPLLVRALADGDIAADLRTVAALLNRRAVATAADQVPDAGLPGGAVVQAMYAFTIAQAIGPPDLAARYAADAAAVLDWAGRPEEAAALREQTPMSSQPGQLPATPRATAPSGAMRPSEAAVELARAGRFAEAFRMFEDLDRQQKLDWRGRGDWGIALLWAERYTDALGQLTRATRDAAAQKHPHDYLIRALAIATAGAGDTERSWQMVTDLLLPQRDNPDVIVDLRGIAAIYDRQGMELATSAREAGEAIPEASIGLIQRALMVATATGIEDLRTTYGADLGIVLGWAGRHNEAVEVLSGLPRPVTADKAYILRALGESFEALGRHQEAIAAFEDARMLDDIGGQAAGGILRIAEGMAARGIEDARRGNESGDTELLARGIATIRSACNLAPPIDGFVGDTDAANSWGRHFADLGIALNWAGRPDEALAALDRSSAYFTLLDGEVPAYVQMARASVLYGVGRRHEAIAIGSELRRRMPDDPAVADLLVGFARGLAADGIQAAQESAKALSEGQADVARARREDALEAFDRALTIAPDAWQVLSDCGMGEVTLGLFEQAAAHLRSALAAQPEPYIARSLVEALIGLGRPAEALDLAEAWARQYPDYVPLADARAWAAAEMSGAIVAQWQEGEHEAALAGMSRLAGRVEDVDQVQLDYGRMLQWAGKYTEAVCVLENLLARLSEPPAHAILDLAGAYVGLGRYDEALRCYATVEAMEPENPRVRDGYRAVAYRIAAEAMERLQETEEPDDAARRQALACLERALELAPELWAIRADMGWVLFGLKRYDESAAALGQAVHEAGREARAYQLVWLGDSLLALSRYRDAEAAYQRALQIEPDNRLALLGLSQIPYGLGEIALAAASDGSLEAARERIQKALEADPGNPLVNVEAGVLAAWDHRTDEAIQRLEEWLPRCDDPPVLGYVALSDAYIDAGLPENAVAMWERRPAQWPDPKTSGQVRSRAAAQISRWAREFAEDRTSWRRAEELYEACMRLDPTNPVYPADYGILMMWEGRYGEAQRYLTASWELSEAPSGYVLRSLADAISMGEHPERALEYYRDALRLNDRDWGALSGMGRTLAWLGRTDEALALYDQALEKEPYSSQAIAGRAYVLASANRLKEALREYDRALAISPRDKSLRLGKATTLNWIGWHDQAYDMLKDLLREYPGYTEARIQLVAAAQYSGRPKEAVETWEHLDRELSRPKYLDETRWELRPYVDPSVSVALDFSADSDTHAVSTPGLVLRWPIEPEFRAELHWRHRTIRERNVAGTDWTSTRVALEWQISPEWRFSGYLQRNRVANVGVYEPTTYELRADYRQDDKLSWRGYYRHVLLEASRALVDRTSGHEYGLGATYRVDHRNRYSGEFSSMAVTDGNVRSWFTANWVHRLKDERGRWSDVVVEWRHMSNTRTSDRYWSPRSYDSLMAKYIFGEDDFDRGWWWRIVTGAGIAHESGAGWSVPLALELHGKKRVGEDGVIEAGIGGSRSGIERTAPGSSPYQIGWGYAGYTHYF